MLLACGVKPWLSCLLKSLPLAVTPAWIQTNSVIIYESVVKTVKNGKYPRLNYSVKLHRVVTPGIDVPLHESSIQLSSLRNGVTLR